MQSAVIELQYPVQCNACGSPILLPNHMLGHFFGDLSDSIIRSSAIAFVCHRCRRLQVLNVEDFVTGQIRGLPRASDTLFCGWLERTDASCKLLVPLYAQWPLDFPENDRAIDAMSWMWDNLRCSAGHTILKPAAFARTDSN